MPLVLPWLPCSTYLYSGLADRASHVEGEVGLGPCSLTAARLGCASWQLVLTPSL